MLVIFDLDGTLTDPHDGITRCVTHTFQRLGRPSPSLDQLRGFIGPPLQDTFGQWLPADEVDQAIRLYRERFDALGWRENRVYDGIPALLNDVARAGRKMIIATSKPAVFAQRIVDHFKLSGLFDSVVGATLDGSLRHKSDLIAKALSESDIPASDAVMIGDRAQDIVGAKANGVRAIGVEWGYAEVGELEAADADAIATSPQDLPGLIGA